MTYEEFLKRYEFDTQDKKALLGSGGFGSVHKAFDSVQKRYVAVKIAEVKHEKFNLLYEKQIVDELDSHENVARYGNCYRFQFMPVRYDYAILNFYEEGNLADVLKKYPLTISQKQAVLEGILKGIGHLHRHHIIHRDMKPQNILMERQGNRWIPKLTDFGLSKLADTNTRPVENSAIGLSIAYAAPEQIQNREIKHNVDLWAFGIIAYHMFIGDLPFDATRSMSQESWNLEVSKQIVKAKAPEKLSQVPEPFRTIIKKCLVADNTKRVQKAEELLAILGASPAPKIEKQPLNDENTIRINEPFSNVKELTTRADEFFKAAESKSGFEKEHLVNEALKKYQEVLDIDPSNIYARSQVDICTARMKKPAPPFKIPSKKVIWTGAAGVLGIVLIIFFYWQSAAEKDLNWAKSAFFSKAAAHDSLKTNLEIYQILDKYSGTLAMDDTCNYILGVFYKDGKAGVQPDFKTAMEYFERGEDYEWAKYSLAKLYFEGKGTRTNYETAAEYYEAAYNQKQILRAAECLGYIYAEGGFQVKQDYSRARTWFERAALAKSSLAQFELGRIYHDGLGVPKDEAKAKYYYGLSAAQGNWNAQQSLYSMSKKRKNPYTAAINPYQASKSKHSKPKSNAGAFWQKVGNDLFNQAIRK